MSDIERCNTVFSPSHGKMLDLMSAPVVVVNEFGQAVFANGRFMDLAGIGSSEEYLGLRLGEIMGCPYAGISLSGCGTSLRCQSCEISGFMSERLFEGGEDDGKACANVPIDVMHGAQLSRRSMEFGDSRLCIWRIARGAMRHHEVFPGWKVPYAAHTKFAQAR